MSARTFRSPLVGGLFTWHCAECHEFGPVSSDKRIIDGSADAHNAERHPW